MVVHCSVLVMNCVSPPTLLLLRARVADSSSGVCPVESPCERALLLTLRVKCAYDHHACLVYTHISQLG
jgi:hypothetical protein